MAGQMLVELLQLFRWTGICGGYALDVITCPTTCHIVARVFPIRLRQ